MQGVLFKKFVVFFVLFDKREVSPQKPHPKNIAAAVLAKEKGAQPYSSGVTVTVSFLRSVILGVALVP